MLIYFRKLPVPGKLALRGIDADCMRAPQLDLPEEEIADLKRKLDELNAITRYE